MAHIARQLDEHQMVTMASLESHTMPVIILVPQHDGILSFGTVRFLRSVSHLDLISPDHH